MEKTQAYEEIITGINPLGSILHLVQTLLGRLKEDNAITYEQWKAMMPNITKCELPHLYFIPRARKVDVRLRPIISYRGSPTIGISTFLNNLLAPLYLRVVQTTTYMRDIDFTRQLEKYRDSGQLKATTMFVTFDVTDLYTMITRDGALNSFVRFLRKHSKNGKISNLSINTIIRLARIVLDTNSFVYNGKYYKQIRGDAMGSPFTMVLANIYMLEWEQNLVEHQQAHNELYGRYAIVIKAGNLFIRFPILDISMMFS
ncbi:unnamed protein product [Rotaria sp. Silwood2]|nr:unnamed protein product [Rotaria sp. Silwood2]